MTPRIALRKKTEKSAEKPQAPHRQADLQLILSSEFRDRPLDEQVTVLNPAQLLRDIVIYHVTGVSVTGKKLDGSKEHEIVRNALAEGLRNHYAQAQHMVDLALRRLHDDLDTSGIPFDRQHYVQPIADKLSRLEFITRGIDETHVHEWWRSHGRPITLRQLIPADSPLLEGSKPRETFEERFERLSGAISQGSRGEYASFADTKLSMTGHALSRPSLVTFAQVPGSVIDFPTTLPGRALVREKSPESLFAKIMREISEYASKEGILRLGPEDAVALFNEIRVFDIAAGELIVYVPPSRVERVVGAVVRTLKTDKKFNQYYPWPGTYTHKDASKFEQNDYNQASVPQGRVKMIFGTNELPRNARRFGITRNVNMRMELNITDITSKVVADITGPLNHEAFERERNRFYRDKSGKTHRYSAYYEKMNSFFYTAFENQFNLR